MSLNETIEHGIENLETHSRKMFIIDDDPIQTEMIKDFIQDRFIFGIKTFSDGESALKEVVKYDPEIIVLDFHLNSQNPAARDGISILKELKKIHPSSKVFMFSGEDNVEVATESMRNGAYDFIIKGETAFNKLESTINRLGDMNQMEAMLKAQRRSITVLTAGIVLIIAAAIIYYFSK